MRRMLPQPGLGRRLLLALFSLIGVPVIYLLTAFGLMLFPANSDFQNNGKISITLRSNGVHLDLILPVRHGSHDWREAFEPADFQSLPESLNYIAIGWGDAEFYLNTPTWQDLSLRTAVSALLGQGPSLLHVEYLADADFSQINIRVDRVKYAELIKFVNATVARADPTFNTAIVVPGASYYGDDAFFEANGSYTAIHTCNAWVGDALRKSGVRMSVWTPFAVNVEWNVTRSL